MMTPRRMETRSQTQSRNASGHSSPKKNDASSASDPSGFSAIVLAQKLALVGPQPKRGAAKMMMQDDNNDEAAAVKTITKQERDAISWVARKKRIAAAAELEAPAAGPRLAPLCAAKGGARCFEKMKDVDPCCCVCFIFTIVLFFA